MKHRELLIIGLKLCLICAVAALCLGLLNEVTEPVIIARKEREEKDALGQLIPSGVPGEKVSVDGSTVVAYYPVIVKGNLDKVILNLCGIGYGGDMKILAAYEKDGTIIAVRLLDNLETPGLGKKAEEPAYMNKFRGKGGREEPVPTSKEMLQSARSPAAGSGAPPMESGKQSRFRFFPGEAAGSSTDTVSGATITFLGVSKALARGAEYVRNKWGGK